MRDKFYFFLGQGFLASIAPVAVMIQSRFDHHTAATLSIALSIVSVIFSISYFGQRAYIVVKGNSEVSYEVAGAFRVWSIIAAVIASLLFCYVTKLALIIPMMVILLKLSEAAIDFWNGVMIYEQGTTVASKKFFYLTSLRALLLIAALIFLHGLIDKPLQISVLLIAVVVVTYAYCIYNVYHISRIQKLAMLDIGKLINASQKMFPFVLATSVCAVLSASPRWTIALLPHGQFFTVDAISLSAIPILVLLYQALWISSLRNLTTNFIPAFKKLVFQVLLVSTLMMLTYPVWPYIIRFVYKITPPVEVQHFSYVVAAGIVFFAAMSLQNVFKAIRPLYESLGYVLGVSGIIFAVVVLRLPIQNGLLLGALAMLLNLLFLIKLCKN